MGKKPKIQIPPITIHKTPPSVDYPTTEPLETPSKTINRTTIRLQLALIERRLTPGALALHFGALHVPTFGCGCARA